MSESDTAKLLTDTARTGVLTGVGTTLATILCGQIEDGEAIAPINAISHIAWGEEAARHTEYSAKYTLTGLLLNCAAVAGWSAIYHLLFRRSIERRDLPTIVAGGPIVSAAAYITDYAIVPERFTPGFEKRLSDGSLWCIYTTLAAGLVFGGLAALRDR